MKGTKLDNIAIILGVIGLISVIFGYLFSKNIIGSSIYLIALLLGVCGFIGLIIGIVSLVKGSEQKIKPILAIVFYIIIFILNMYFAYGLR